MYAKIVNDDIKILLPEVTLQSIEAKYREKLRQNKLSDTDLAPILQKTEDKRSVEEMKRIIVRKYVDDCYKKEIEDFNSYKRYTETIPEGAGELDSYEFFFTETENEIVRNFRIIKNDKRKVTEKINELKQKIADTDWKVVRCYEASLMNEDMPYNVKELGEYRASIRSEIKQLQELL